MIRKLSALLKFLTIFGVIALSVPVWSLPTAPGLDNHASDVGVNVRMTVQSVDVDRDQLTAKDGTGRIFTVDTYHSSIELRATSRPGETGDLMAGMRIQITGSLLSDDIIAAVHILVLPVRSAIDQVPSVAVVPKIDVESPTTVRGIIESVNSIQKTILLRIDDQERLVHLSDDTEMRDIGIAEDGTILLREGDHVTVVGKLERDGSVMAELVTMRNLQTPYTNTSADASPQSSQVHGIVVQESDRLSSRKIKVQQESGREITVDVPHGATVYRAGRSISVHEIKNGELVRIDGIFNGNGMRATSITVTGLAYNSNAAQSY